MFVRILDVCFEQCCESTEGIGKEKLSAKYIWGRDYYGAIESHGTPFQSLISLARPTKP